MKTSALIGSIALGLLPGKLISLGLGRVCVVSMLLSPNLETL
jgi:hypothetical protein